MSNIWTSDIKTSVCDACPNSDTRGDCLLVGNKDNRATITFILEKPMTNSCVRRRPLQDRDGNVFLAMLRAVRTAIGDLPPYNVIYLVGAASQKAPSKDVVSVCSQYVDQKLLAYRKEFALQNPADKRRHILVPLGAAASRFLVPTLKSLKDARGQIHPITRHGYSYDVIPTLGLSQISVQPGAAPILQRDIATAMQLGKRSTLPDVLSVDDLTSEYFIPKNEQELLEVTELILNYTDPAKQPNPDDWPIAIDTETNTLNAWWEGAKVLMVSIAWDDGKSTAISIQHPEAPYPEDVARTCVARILASKKPKIFHNLKFDWQILELSMGLPINNVWWDTMLAEHFFDEDKRGFYSLDELTKAYSPAYRGYKAQIQVALKDVVKQNMLKGIEQETPDPDVSFILAPFYPDVEYEPACEGELPSAMLDVDKRRLFLEEQRYIIAHLEDDKKTKSSARGRVRTICKRWGIAPPETIKTRNYEASLDSGGYELVPYDVLLVYAATDTDVTRLVCKQQNRRAHKERVVTQLTNVMRDLYIRGSFALGKMEFQGTYLDTERLQEYINATALLAKTSLEDIQNVLCDADFNPGSKKQMAKVLSTRLAIAEEDFVFTDTGEIGVRKDWVDAMAEKYGGDTGAFFRGLNMHRAAQKANSTFLTSFQELSALDGHIHTSFWLNGTKTGRLSSSNPNLQNIPSYICRMYDHKGWNLKHMFIPRKEGHAFWQMDISQAEIRVLCAYSQDPELIHAVRSGMDTHSFITAKVFNYTYEHVAANKDSDPVISHQRDACKRVVFGMIYGAGARKIAEQIYGSISSDPVEEAQQVGFAREVMATLFDKFPRIQQYVSSTQAEARQQGYVESFFGRRRRFQLNHVDNSHLFKAQREAINFKIQSSTSDVVLSQLIEISENLDDIGATMLLTVHDSMAGEIPYENIPLMREFFDKYIRDRVVEKFDWLPVPFAYDLDVGPSYGLALKYDLAVKPETELTEKDLKDLDKVPDELKEFRERVQRASA